MAWTCIVASLLYPMLVLFTSSDQLGSIAGPYYVFLGLVLTNYFAFATLDDIKADANK